MTLLGIVLGAFGSTGASGDLFHATAMGPGLVGQLVDKMRSAPASTLDCQRCHSPHPVFDSFGLLQKNQPGCE